ncbi:N-acetylmuramoyl-L-alanine amidase [Deinococcus fonticola]|uniref:N-acetylmuramoyl-L-alanine amidase n=1 Tax=Deinococcus fonticola TaxID=2528713 RepID=UPI001074AB0C|nr:N-acetylmuramoyl-L-alanine amidase [Deinococcus fonticola]
MKARATLLSSALLLSSWAAAQTDPFQRGAPPQATPSLRSGNAVTVPGATLNVPPPAAATPASASAASPVTAFGNPRSSSDGNTTRIVFDLPASPLTYTLTPTFSGLRIDVQGARVIPAVTARLGATVTEYRAGGGQVTLVTPFPLSTTEGWRASEATIAGGTRVLILEFGGTLSGGAGPTVKGRVLAAAPATTTAAQATLSAPLPTSPSAAAGAGLFPGTVGSGAAGAVGAGTVNHATVKGAQTALTSGGNGVGLPPGDTIRTGPVVPAPALPGADSEKPSPLTGRVPGDAGASVPLSAPRIGKNPGLTRVVLDLPAGASYRLVPTALGMRVELSGVTVGPAAQMEADVSPEVRGWRYDAVSGGVHVSLLTAAPTTVRSGWRSQLLPPASGSDRYRLAIDLSPALADTTALKPSEKIVASVPPIPTARGTAILALSASYARPRVVIDPGHGGIDPGAVGAVVEKEVNLAVGLRVRDLLKAAGVDVVMTRDRDTQLSRDKNTDLNMRAGLGTPGTQLYVSIHVNAMAPANVLRGYGIETWWNPNHPLSQNLAALLQRNTIQTTAAFDQGLKSSRSLAVLRNSRIPAALIEVGFTSHPVDGLNLRDDNYLDRLALGIANGIRDALITGVTANNSVTRSAVGGAGK